MRLSYHANNNAIKPETLSGKLEFRTAVQSLGGSGRAGGKNTQGRQTVRMRRKQERNCVQKHSRSGCGEWGLTA